MKIDPFRGPRSRAAFERNIHHLKEALIGGRLRLPAQFETFGILRIRKLPNGRIDMLSINESARLMANMMAMDFGGMVPEAFGVESGDLDNE